MERLGQNSCEKICVTFGSNYNHGGQWKGFGSLAHGPWKECRHLVLFSEGSQVDLSELNGKWQVA